MIFTAIGNMEVALKNAYLQPQRFGKGGLFKTRKGRCIFLELLVCARSLGPNRPALFLSLHFIIWWWIYPKPG